jgi:hypothetical protein
MVMPSEQSQRLDFFRDPSRQSLEGPAADSPYMHGSHCIPTTADHFIKLIAIQIAAQPQLCLARQHAVAIKTAFAAPEPAAATSVVDDRATAATLGQAR